MKADNKVFDAHCIDQEEKNTKPSFQSQTNIKIFRIPIGSFKKIIINLTH